MAQWKTIPILVVVLLLVCCGCIFAQPQAPPPPQGGAPPGPDPRMEQAIDMMFRAMDTDHDGTISKKEWMAFQEKQFNLINKSGSGFITKDEVRADMKERMRQDQEQMRRRPTPQ
ncbi:MAG: hypothetical protein ABSC04_20290 [Syntrophobacteraceae bacterium]|jgi:hypothetical protein